MKARISRGPINRLTGDGVLVLETDKGRLIKLKGLAPIADLEIIKDRLNELSRSLRNNPIFRGIIN
jgi:hypothetical protein